MRSLCIGSEFDKKSAIHNMIVSAISKSSISYNGKSDSMRQYIHIKDAVMATIKTMDKKYDNSSVSIVGNENYRVKDIMILISEILNKTSNIIQTNETSKSTFKIKSFKYITL